VTFHVIKAVTTNNYIFMNLNAVKFGNNFYRFRKNFLKLTFVMEEFTLLTTTCHIPEGYLNFHGRQSPKFNKSSLKFVISLTSI